MNDKNKPAGKRRPLALKKKDGTRELLYCDDHGQNRATFKCMKCGFLFCEECVGGEIQGKPYCVGCKGFYGRQGVDKQQSVSQKKKTTATSSGKSAEVILAVAAIGLILFLTFYVYQNSEPPHQPMAIEDMAESDSLAEELTVQDAQKMLDETGKKIARLLNEKKPLIPPGGQP